MNSLILFKWYYWVIRSLSRCFSLSLSYSREIHSIPTIANASEYSHLIQWESYSALHCQQETLRVFTGHPRVIVTTQRRAFIHMWYSPLKHLSTCCLLYLELCSQRKLLFQTVATRELLFQRPVFHDKGGCCLGREDYHYKYQLHTLTLLGSG